MQTTMGCQAVKILLRPAPSSMEEESGLPQSGVEADGWSHGTGVRLGPLSLRIVLSRASPNAAAMESGQTEGGEGRASPAASSTSTASKAPVRGRWSHHAPPVFVYMEMHHRDRKGRRSVTRFALV
jgi:hypothetical protein